MPRLCERLALARPPRALRQRGPTAREIHYGANGWREVVLSSAKGKPLFEKPQTPPLGRPPTKDSILRQVDGLRDLARRARRLSSTMTSESDERRLVRYVEELEESATRLEQAAVGAKTG